MRDQRLPITIQTIAARAVLDIDPQAILIGADRYQEGARVVVIGVAAGVLDLSRPDRTFVSDISTPRSLRC